MMSSPEPMTLGSPTQSPSSSNAINQYLPQFLLGDMPTSGMGGAGHHHHLHPNSQFNNPNHPYHASTGGGGAGSYSGHHHSNQTGNHSFLNASTAGGFGREMSSNSHYQMGGGAFNQYGSGPGSANYSPHHDRTLNPGVQIDVKPSIPGGPPLNRLADVLNKPAGASSNNNSFYNTPNDVQRTKLFSQNNNASYYSGGMNQTGGGNDLFGMDAGLTKLNIHHHQQQQQDLPFTPAGCVNNISLGGGNQRLSGGGSPTHGPIMGNDTLYNDSILGREGESEESALACWITIFGFPPSSATYVLQEFSVCGQIVRHITCAQGNWMHIQYQTRLQAQKALGKNGKVIGNSIMLGVMKCIDRSVLGNGETGENSNAGQNSTFVSPASTSILNNPALNRLGGSGNRTFNGLNSSKLDRSQSLRAGVRPPLGALNQNGASKLPKKNTNVLSKAMEYMFGW